VNDLKEDQSNKVPEQSMDANLNQHQSFIMEKHPLEKMLEDMFKMEDGILNVEEIDDHAQMQGIEHDMNVNHNNVDAIPLSDEKMMMKSSQTSTNCQIREDQCENCQELQTFCMAIETLTSGGCSTEDSSLMANHPMTLDDNGILLYGWKCKTSSTSSIIRGYAICCK
jgi:hypothetical protein